MLASSRNLPDKEEGGNVGRDECDDVSVHNGGSIHNLNSESQLSRGVLDIGGVENDGPLSQEPPEDETDDERDALIAGFKEHLKRSTLEECDPIRNERPIKVVHDPKARDERKCNKEIIRAEKIDTSSHKEQIKLTSCVLDDKSNTSNMTKYDHRRDPSVAMDSGKNTAKHAINYKKTYLFLYNLTRFIMFLMVHLILSIETLSGKMDDASVQGAAFIVRLLTYTQLLESIHPMLGLVPGGPFMPFIQVFGRLLVNHFLTDTEIRIDSFPYAHYLFIVWSSIEIFRYSFYALRVFNVQIYPITWARYTLFMPLYPMGGFCEAQIVMATVRHLEKTGAYTIELPNPANFSFSLPLFLRFYTLALLWPSIFYLMKYMWSQRCKQLKEKSE